jgi:hypothetical protein
MKWFSTLFCLLSLPALASSSLQGVYGKDHRQDIYQVLDPNIRRTAASTMAMFSSEDLEKKGSYYKIVADQLGEYYELCPEEKFFYQPIASYCSAALITPSIVLTAGHCVEPEECSDTRFVFDYQYDNPGRDVTVVPETSVYSCKKIIARQSDYNLDFALVQLDRPVTDRSPLKLATANIKPGENIFMLGYPSGLPLKYSGPGMAHEQGPDYFYAYIDSFSGNSGSSVFSMKSKEIVGILARGIEDYYLDKKRKCHKAYDCKSNGCYGEEITNIEPVLKVLGLKK